MDFRQYKTAEELKAATGLTPQQALKIIDAEIEALKQRTN